MARPRSEDKREAILDAAAQVIAAQGLSAPTAAIAKTAGVATGSLFTYFETKAALLNVLYVELKAEMARASGEGLVPDAGPREALWHVWSGWVDWATERPERRKALLLLGTSDELSTEAREAGHRVMAPLARLLEHGRTSGSMRNSSLGYLSALMNATADATIDFMLSDPKNADNYRREGFEALWRVIA